MSDILLSKLMPPQIKKGIIDRPRLLKLCAGMDERKLTLLTAPAGYGKTILMLQAANESGWPLVWYQLDAYDNDLVVFIRNLVAGIERKIPGFGSQVQHIIAGGSIENNLRLLVTVIVNELSQYTGNPLLLVFDDYHEIINPLTNLFLKDFLKYLPAHVHVMIASRTLPSINFARLKTGGEILMVDMKELSFTSEEMQAFFAKKAPQLTDETRIMLEQKVNGWPAAVTLIVNSDKGDGSSLRLNDGTTEIYEYLASEVLDRQPDSVSDFMKKIAVLDIITAEDCDLLLKRNDSQQILDLLENQNLFLIPLAGLGKSYRYHQLFKEFLFEKLGAERQLWQREAGIIACSRGDLSSAVEYFGAAGAEYELRDIIKEAGKQAFSHGCWRTVARWLEAIAEDDLASDPWLSLYRAKSEIYQGRLDEAEKWLHAAGPLFAYSGDQTGLTENRLLHARILRSRGRFEESLELLEQVHNQLLTDEQPTRFDLHLEKFSCLWLLKRYGEAEKTLKDALKIAKRINNNYAMAYILEGLGHVYYGLGDYPRSLEMYKKSTKILPKQLLPSYYMQDYIITIYLDWGEWDKAIDYAKRAAIIKETLGLTDALPSIYGQLATCYFSRGDWQQAEEYCHRAVKLVRENGGVRFVSSVTLCIWAEGLGLQGRWIEAREKAEEALVEARNGGGSENVCYGLGALSLIHTGDIHKGKEWLSMAIRSYEQSEFKRGLCYCYTFQAWLYFSEEKLAEACEYIKKALSLSAKLNILNLFLVHYEMLQPVLKLGMEKGIEITFLQRIFARKGKISLPLLIDLARHENPQVRCWAIAPLAEIGGSQAEEVIRRLANDANADVRQLAGMAEQRLRIATSPKKVVKYTTSALQISMLGPLRVFLQEKELGSIWRTKKARDLLAYLAHHVEPVSKDKILEDLWPDIDPDNSTIIFRTTLCYLRKALSQVNYPETILYSDGRCQLRPGSFSCDYQQFRELVAAGQRMDTSPEEEAASLEQAVTIYRGDYLGDMDYPWLFHHQENLRHLYIDARKRLARYYIDMKDYTRAASHLQVIEECDPFDEEIHTMLMTAYYGQKNRPAIKRQYQKLEALFKKELGFAPSSEAYDLYIRLWSLPG